MEPRRTAVTGWWTVVTGILLGSCLNASDYREALSCPGSTIVQSGYAAKVSRWRQTHHPMEEIKVAGTEMRSGSPLSKVSAAASSAMKKKDSLVKLLYLANRVRKLVSG